MSNNGQHYILADLDVVFEALKARGFTVGQDPEDKGAFRSTVPCRVDNNPSLIIREGNDGHIELYDEARTCDTAEICASLGLDYVPCKNRDPNLPLMEALSPSTVPYRHARDGWGIANTYPYPDADNNLTCDKVRLERTVKGKIEKKLIWRRITHDGNRVWSLNSCRTQNPVTNYPDAVRPGLYQRPDLEQKLKERPDAPVFIVEGEKDADRLWANGHVATCLPHSSGRPARPVRDDLHKLLHRREAILLPDNDEHGRKYSATLAKLLSARASIKVVTLDVSEKGDISDWYDAGGTNEALACLIDETEPTPANIKAALGPVGDLDGKKPILVSDRPTEDMVAEFEMELSESNAELYVRGSHIVCLGTDANDETILQRCTPDRLARKAERHTRPCKLTRDELHHVSIPKHIVADMLANPKPPYPAVKGIARTPIPKANGDICFKPGYD